MDRANMPSKVAVPIYTPTQQHRKVCFLTFLPKVDLMGKYCNNVRPSKPGTKPFLVFTEAIVPPVVIINIFLILTSLT